jgi:hypothetical protein
MPQTGPIEGKPGGRIVQRNNNVVAGVKADLVLDAVELVTGVRADDLVGTHFERASSKGFVKEFHVLRDSHIGDHHLIIIINRGRVVELALEEGSSRDSHPRFRIYTGIEHRDGGSPDGAMATGCQ